METLANEGDDDPQTDPVDGVPRGRICKKMHSDAHPRREQMLPKKRMYYTL